MMDFVSLDISEWRGTRLPDYVWLYRSGAAQAVWSSSTQRCADLETLISDLRISVPDCDHCCQPSHDCCCDRCAHCGRPEAECDTSPEHFADVCTGSGEHRTEHVWCRGRQEREDTYAR